MGFGFVSLVEKWREFCQPITERNKARTKQTRNYFRHSIEIRPTSAGTCGFQSLAILRNRQVISRYPGFLPTKYYLTEPWQYLVGSRRLSVGHLQSRHRLEAWTESLYTSEDPRLLTHVHDDFKIARVIYALLHEKLLFVLATWHRVILLISFA